MRQILATLCTSVALTFALANAPFAQTDQTDITVVSVLTKAKELAGSNWSRMVQVAVHVEHTGQQPAFEAYLADIHSRIRSREDAKNRELIDEAERAFLAGEPERAQELMLQCRWVSNDPCGAEFLARRFQFPSDVVFQVRFLNWELKAGAFDAATRRLKTVEWDRLRAGMTLRVASVLIANGRKAEGARILQEYFGSDLDSCLVENGPIDTAAAFRKMACNGNEADAVALALALQSVSARIHALGMIAEGLAGIPGYSSESLRS
jgi:hypothetical protein